MTQDAPDDETLMAYADGMLEPAESRRIETLLKTRPELLRKVEMFRKTTELVRAAAAPLAQEPVPEALLAAVKAKVEQNRERPGTVVPFASRTKKPALRPWLGQLAAAASVAALGGGLAGYWLAGGESRIRHIAVGTGTPPAVADVLSTAKAGTESSVDAHRMKVIASFRLGDQTLCREFEYSGAPDGAVMGVACRSAGRWLTRFAVAAPSADDVYAPASSYQAVEAYLSAVGAGPPLSAAEEQEALAVN